MADHSLLFVIGVACGIFILLASIAALASYIVVYTMSQSQMARLNQLFDRMEVRIRNIPNRLREFGVGVRRLLKALSELGDYYLFAALLTIFIAFICGAAGLSSALGYAWNSNTEIELWTRPSIRASCGLIIMSVIGFGISWFADFVTRRRNDRAAERRRRIREYSAEAEAVINALRPKPQPQEETHVTERRGELQRQLAIHQQSLEVLRYSEQSPDAVGCAIAEIVTKLKEIEAELSALPSPPDSKLPARTTYRTLLDEAIERRPNNPNLYLLRASQYPTDPSHYQDEIADCDHALMLLPDYAWAFVLRGLAHQYSGKFDLAIKDYRYALDIVPDYETALTNLCSIYNEPGQWKYRQAVKLAEKALRINPNSPHAHEQLAIAYEALGDTEKTVYHYTQILERHPSWADYIRPKRAKLLHALGKNQLVLHDAQTQLAEGKADFDTYDVLIHLEPNNPLHYYGRALLQTEHYEKLRDLERAIQLFNKYGCGVLHSDLAKYIETCSELIREWEIDHYGSHRSSYGILDLYQEQIDAAHKCREYGVLFDVYERAIHFAACREHPEKAQKWSHEELAIARLLAGEKEHENISTAYGHIIQSLISKGDWVGVIDVCLEALPNYNYHGGMFNTLYAVVVELYVDGHHEKAIAYVKTIAERFTDDTTSNANQQLAYEACYFLAGVYAEWPDLPIDLKKARDYARKACKLELRDPEPAALLWAISEAIDGSGDKELVKYVTEPSVRVQARRDGPEQLRIHGLTQQLAN